MVVQVTRTPTAISSHRDYWEVFYAGAGRAEVPQEPSAFARWCGDQLRPGSWVVEIGCGTARDSLWLAARGHQVIGYDYSEAALAHATATAGRFGTPVDFRMLDLYDRPAVLAEARALAGSADELTVYARFLLHAVEDDGQRNVLDFAATALAGGGRFFAEFRTSRDRGRQHVFGEHFRSYPDPDLVTREIEATGGRVVDHQEGHGLAPYRDEDPYVCRLVATWTA